MTIATILVPFNGENEDKVALETAFDLAKQFHSQVECLYVAPDISGYIYPDIGMPNPALGGYIEAFEQTSKDRLAKASALFHSLASQHTIPVSASVSGQVSAHFREEQGDMVHFITQKGVLSDLIIMQGMFASGSAPYKSWAVAALFETGKPVLLTPDHRQTIIGKTVLVAWNGSVESARALHYALPFLKQAKNIHVLAVKDNGSRGMPVENVAEYMALHGIHAEVLTVPSKEHSIGQTILDAAVGVKADLLVMGAFTHTRLRQMIMGGATQFMLEHTKVPVLLAH